MHRTTAEWIAGLAAFATTVHATVPGALRDLILACFVLVVVDTLTGVWLAAKSGCVMSRRLIDKLAAKSLQYMSLVSVCGCLSFLGHTWLVVEGGFAAILSIETLSILENLTRLESAGGVNMGPARPFLERIRKYIVDPGVVNLPAPSPDEKKGP